MLAGTERRARFSYDDLLELFSFRSAEIQGREGRSLA